MSDEEKLREVSKAIRSVGQQIRKLQAQKEQLTKQKEEIEQNIRKRAKYKMKEDLLLQEFPWGEELEKKLSDAFHLQSFRQNQREIINCVLSGQDCFVIMPTGGGKSLCYQLAAIMKPGFSLVITPLISLMHDQCFELKRLGISCGMIYSDTSKEEYNRITAGMRQPPKPNDLSSREKLIYVSPEKLAKSKRLLSLLEDCYKIGSLDHIIVDEAHCCSEWGHDFRPDYKKLSVCKVLFPFTPLVALTATASPKVQSDVEEILRIPECITFSSSVNRANLFYTVLPKKTTPQAVNEQIVEFIESIKNGLLQNENPIGIIYCLSRKETEDISKYLNTKGYKSKPYHASLHVSERDRVHELWRYEKIHIIVATIAFGLGINKANVRFVLHHTVSKSLESYYQESGRAGRDGNFATCCALYRPTDLGKLSSMVYYQNNAIEKLYDMIRYSATRTSCRKSKFLVHFGENASANQSICCDNCTRDLLEPLPEKNLADCVGSLQELMRFLDKSDENVTLLKLVQLWKGQARKSANVPNTVGVAPKDLTLHNCEEIIAELLLENYLQLQFHNTAYSTICYIKADSQFLNMNEETVKEYLNKKIYFYSGKAKTTKRSRTNSAPLALPKAKVPKIVESNDSIEDISIEDISIDEEELDSPIQEPVQISSPSTSKKKKKKKKKKKRDPIVIELDSD